MKRVLIFAIALTASAILQAQTPLPNDPAVKVGKLENGLTYYIRHNEKPSQRAEFYLATNVGAIQEGPGQDGLAHFLEHMCFNGLKNLPGKQMLDYLQSIGASFGGNINASTGVEITQYMLNNIPVIREGIIDTCLLVLHDYSHFVLNEQEEIDAERGVILEEKRTRNTASWRLFEKQLPYLYGDSKYSTCNIIGSEETLKTFTRETLVDYYKTWYRPDNQAVIVVGDIDVNQIETKLKDLFADIPAPVNPRPKDVITIPGNTDPVIGIITDPENTSSSIEVIWKSDAMPEEFNNTDIRFVNDFCNDILYYAMSERFNDIAHMENAPFFGAMFGATKLVETCEAAYGNVNFRDGEASVAFRAMLMEIEKMKRFGFADDEIQRAKDNVLAYYEKCAEAADSRENREFISELTGNFFDNYAFLEPQMAFQLANQVSQMLTRDMINQIAAGIITDENMVVIASTPEKEGIIPSEEELRSIIDEVRNADIEAPVIAETAAEFLNPASLKGSKIKKTSQGLYGSTVWVLKNGVKVNILPTDYKKDQILVRLFKKGGKSLIEDEDLYSFERNIFTLWQNNKGISKFSASELPKMLSGKNISVEPTIQSTYHGISATTTPKDFETALQLVYLTFTDNRFDEAEFNLGVNQIRSMLPNIMSDPNTRLSLRLPKTLYGNKTRCFSLSEEILDKASVASIERVWKDQLFKDAAGVEVFIVGNVNIDEIKPMVEKYFGSLPKGRKASEYVMRDDDIVKGEVTDHFKVPMKTVKNTVVQIYSADVPYSIKSDLEMQAVSYILDMIYTETLREEEGGTYGASTYGELEREPREQAMLQVAFDTNPELVDKLIARAREGLERLASEGPTEDEMTRTIENFKKKIPESRIKNSYWAMVLRINSMYAEDHDAEWAAAVNALDADDVRNFARALLSQKNYVEIVMGAE